MAAISYTLLLLSVFCISCIHSAAGTEVDAAGTEVDVAGTVTDQSTTTDNDTLEILVRSLIQDVQEIRILMDAFCKNDKGYKDCMAVYKAGHTTSGVYRIKPDGVNEVDAYCLQRDGGGWTVIQSRNNGSVDFYRGWCDYKHGFGKAAGEYWLGNHHIHALTADRNQKMTVELLEGAAWGYAYYNSFRIDNEAHNYKLTVSGYTGNAGDALSYHSGMAFSTHDRDNDAVSAVNCAKVSSGAWWYKGQGCHSCNLNGHYNVNIVGKGINWNTWIGHKNSISSTVMMVQPK